jgi:hypothetical protein
MKWLKHLGPLVLSQSSNIPYVILEDGVKLCFDNVYHVDPISKDQEHHIQFNVHKKDIIRQSTSHFRLKNFPVIVPFEDILSLDKTVIDGRIIKTCSGNKGKPQKIFIVQSSFLKEMEENEFQEIVDSMQSYDKTFLLIKEDVDSLDRLLVDEAELIPHFGWYRTIVTIADKVCNNKLRKYCWTKSLPELSISIHGINGDGETEFISKCFDDIGIVDKEIIWL